MDRQTISAILLSIAATLIAAASAQASLITTASLPEYQSPNGYDFSDAADEPPLASYQNIGTFTFAPVSIDDIGSITISGTFGNMDFNSTTALSQYSLGDAVDGETRVGVAQCDLISWDCYSGQAGPYSWTFTLSGSQITALTYGLTHGSLDFGYVWGLSSPRADAVGGDANGYDLQYIEAGPTNLSLFTPEPATALFCLSGLATIVWPAPVS